MRNIEIRHNYQGLSRQALLDKAYELAFHFEKYSGSCSQSTIAALHQLLEMSDVAVLVASSSAGGQAGQVVGTCGGLIGGTMALDYFFGREAGEMSHEEDISGNVEIHMNAVDIATLLYNRYVKEYGTILCPHIQVRLYGRHFYILDGDEHNKFDKAGAHSNTKRSCCVVVGNAARWAMEILLELREGKLLDALGTMASWRP
jgi:C_GCAxxG_C_C family probable redox protein